VANEQYRERTIPSVEYLHIRNDHKRVSEVVDESNSRMSPELQLVSNYILQDERKMKGVTNSITPPKKRTKTNVNITPPSNGVQYRKSEVVNELRKYQAGNVKFCCFFNGLRDVMIFSRRPKYIKNVKNCGESFSRW